MHVTGMDVKMIIGLELYAALILTVFVTVSAHTTTVGPDFGPLEPEFVTCAEDPMICPENSKCVDMETYTYCECAAGKTGVNCSMDDPCLETTEKCTPKIPKMKCFGPCNPNVFCEGATGIAHCTTCLPGWIGEECSKDEDECTLYDDICNNRGTCNNTVGGYECACDTGYRGASCELKGGIGSGTVGCSISLLTVFVTSAVSFLWI